MEQPEHALDSATLAKAFDADYFTYHCGPVPYERNDEFLKLFDYIAGHIARDIEPTSVFDAGCAIGLLVEGLRKQGIEAYGMDISEFAISQVAEEYREFCTVGSVTEPLGRTYDLITCIEVLEHLLPEDAKKAIENLCQYTDDILFSSSPLDYKEVSHVNVHPPEYWVEQFARHDFYRDVEFDASFLSPWAVRLKRRREPIPRIIAPYERRLWELLKENQACREVILEQRNELMGADARLRAEAGRADEERQEILAQLRAHHTAFLRAYLTNNAERDIAQQAAISELQRQLEANHAAYASSLAEQQAVIEGIRAEGAMLSHCAAAMFFALEATPSTPPRNPAQRLLAPKQRPVPLTPEETGQVARIRSGRQSIWHFAKTEGPLTFQAELKPGRHVLRLKALASEPIDLIVSAGPGQPRALGRLDRHVTDLTLYVEVTAPSGQLSLSFPKPVPLAIVGGLSLLREIDEAPTRIVKRRLLGQAGRIPMARRLARSRVGRAIRPLAATSAPVTAAPSTAAVPSSTPAFAPWMQDRIRERQPLYQIKPKEGLFSLLTSAWNTPVPYLDALAKSVFGQWDFPTFEWIVLDNGSTEPETIAYLQTLAEHPQVKLFRVEQNRGIIGGMRYCLEQATGRYIVPLDSDDYLYPDCLRIMAWHIEQHGYPALMYSDEDKIQEGVFRDEYLKPDWDPVLFLNSCYIAHLDAIDREKALELGAYSDSGADGCHDWDTFIRFMLAGYTPVHVPEVVYSWRMHSASAALDIMSKSYIFSSHEHVLGKFLAAQPNAERYRVEKSPLFGGYPEWWFRRAHTHTRPLLSLVLSRDPGRMDTEALRKATDYPDHRVQAISLYGQTEELGRLAAEQAERGGLIHLLYEDVVQDGNEWPWEVLAVTELHPDTVMVGGPIQDGAGLIVAAGEYFGVGGICGSPDVGRPLGHPGYFGQMWKQRSVSAVSSMLAVVDARFVVELLQHASSPRMSLPFFGVWAGAYARRTNKRIVYSPFLLGTAAAGRAAWDALVTDEEREAFVRANFDLLPDTRFLSAQLSLDPARPYVPMPTAERLAYLRQHQPALPV